MTPLTLLDMWRRSAAKVSPEDSMHTAIDQDPKLTEGDAQSLEIQPSTFPSRLDLRPIKRGPTALPEATVEAILAADASMVRRPIRTVSDRSTPPTASLVVVVFDGLPFTKLCLESLLAN